MKDDSKDREGVVAQLEKIREARRSGARGRIQAAYRSAESARHSEILLPSVFHTASTLYTAPVFEGANIAGELHWATLVLADRKSELRDYIAFKSAVEDRILRGKWDDALKLIVEFELRYGTSAVLKEIEIGIIQQSEGTVKQIAYCRRLEAGCTKNAMGLFLRHTSERNEDRLPLSGFRRNFREILESDAITPLIATIINWHGLHQTPCSDALLADLLAFEGTGSLFDYFEAFVAAATQISIQPSIRLREVLRKCLQSVGQIDDQRLVNINGFLSGSFEGRGVPLTAKNVLLEICNRKAYQPENSEILMGTINFLDEPAPEGEVRRGVHKMSVNFYHLDVFQAMFHYLEHKTSVACLERSLPPGLVVLSSKTSLRSALAFDLQQATAIFQQQTHSLTPGYVGANSSHSSDEYAADIVIFRALELSRSSRVSDLIVLAQQAIFGGLDKCHLQLIAIESCCKDGRPIDILALALDVAELRVDSLLLVPTVQALERIMPSRISGKDAVLFSLVAARIMQVVENDRLEDKLIVAVEAVYTKREEILAWLGADPSAKRHWVAFLRDVLVVQNMLLIDQINSLSDALKLRLDVLRELADLDQDRRAIYHEEVRDIAFGMSVDEGVRQVNTSRLNVNVQGLTKWANEHCVDDYERYKELIIGEAKAGNLPLKLSTGAVSFLDQVVGIPIGAADDHLIKLLARIRAAYLSDPRNGLDAYISLRVRHGSLAGTLSRGLDIRQLLLLRKGEGGPFESPLYWIEKFELGDGEAALLTVAFATFTGHFRKSVDDLLQNRLRVKSDRYPQGEITVEITNIFVKGLKIDILGDLPFDSFLTAVLLAYKNAVSAYLESLRRYLREDFLNGAVRALEALSESVKAIVADDLKRNAFNDALTSARLDLQSSIKMVCGWLEIAQKEDLAQLYNLSQATEVGINYTRQVRNDFQPRLSVQGQNESFRLTGSSLIFVVDILFIMLDNVYKHAGCPNSRSIRLDYDLSAEGIIKITMHNDLDSDIDIVEVAHRLEAARKLIADGEGERKLTEEDKSGLPKLSRLVAPNLPSALTFRVVDDEVQICACVAYSSLGVTQ